MPAAARLPHDWQNEMRRRRRLGQSWGEVGGWLRVTESAAFRIGARIGLTGTGARDALPQPANQDDASQLDLLVAADRRSADSGWALPPGDPASWGAITRETCLDGAAYGR